MAHGRRHQGGAFINLHPVKISISQRFLELQIITQNMFAGFVRGELQFFYPGPVRNVVNDPKYVLCVQSTDYYFYGRADGLRSTFTMLSEKLSSSRRLKNGCSARCRGSCNR